MTKKAKIHFVTGGQRSGKSSYAEKLALAQNDNPVYMATSRIWDEGHRKRIERHQADRGSCWQTIEEEKYISTHKIGGRVVLVDCVTLWLTNFFFDCKSDVEAALNQAKKEFDNMCQMECEYIIVTNEIGMGAFPIDKLQIAFTDLQGWMNQYIAEKADSVTLMVSGLPLKVK